MKLLSKTIICQLEDLDNLFRVGKYIKEEDVAKGVIELDRLDRLVSGNASNRTQKDTREGNQNEVISLDAVLKAQYAEFTKKGDEKLKAAKKYRKALAMFEEKDGKEKVVYELMTTEVFQTIDQLAKEKFQNTWMYMGSTNPAYYSSLTAYAVGLSIILGQHLVDSAHNDADILKQNLEPRLLRLFMPKHSRGHPLPIPTGWVIEKMHQLLNMTQEAWKEVTNIEFSFLGKVN
jgi:hypothetical protein